MVLIPFAKALSANGEMNVSSNERLRAIHAIELATVCSLVAQRSPCTCKLIRIKHYCIIHN